MYQKNRMLYNLYMLYILYMLYMLYIFVGRLIHAKILIINLKHK